MNTTRNPNGTFKAGRKRPSAEVTKQRLTNSKLIAQGKWPVRKNQKVCWGTKTKEHMVEKQRARLLIKYPIGSKRQHNANGKIYWVIKVADRGKWKYEHRVAMSKHLNRPLLKSELVHHLNGNTLDNRLENLTLTNIQAHNSLHFTLNQWTKKYKACLQCGTTERKHGGKGLCRRCYQRMIKKVSPSDYRR